MQEPIDPASAHDLQVAAHAVEQQTPCAQKPESQSVLWVHEAPIGERPQLPFMHSAGETHSLFPEQVVRQSLPAPQTNGAHVSEDPAMQVPTPSQVDASRRVDPVQLPGEQTVPCTYLRQAPAPSHVPSLPQLVAPSSPHSLAGSVPAGTGEQVPILPAMLQAWQASVQVVSQQTPSTQRPFEHSPPAVQSAPIDFFGMQLVPTQ
jgi:hypothetical protein